MTTMQGRVYIENCFENALLKEKISYEKKKDFREIKLSLHDSKVNIIIATSIMGTEITIAPVLDGNEDFIARLQCLLNEAIIEGLQQIRRSID